MESQQAQLPPPPGMIASLARGFDSVATHVLVILPPVLLDLFLWLGPRLQLKDFLGPIVRQIPNLARALPSNGVNVSAAQQFWTGFADRFNLFMSLRTFPVGASSLLSFKMAVGSPFGSPASLDAGSFLGILGWAGALVLLGWLVGALYFYWVAGVALKPQNRSLARALQQTILLSIIWLMLLLLLGLPVFSLLSFLSYISPVVAQIMLIVGLMIVLWLAMPVFFSAHGIFTFQLDAFRAILSSLRLTRFTLPTTAMFLLILVVINQGLNFLWNTPAQDSWWTLVGIGGHAFVSTALLAASFVYYRDASTWLKAVLEHLRKQTTSVKV